MRAPLLKLDVPENDPDWPGELRCNGYLDDDRKIKCDAQFVSMEDVWFPNYHEFCAAEDVVINLDYICCTMKDSNPLNYKPTTNAELDDDRQLFCQNCGLAVARRLSGEIYFNRDLVTEYSADGVTELQ